MDRRQLGAERRDALQALLRGKRPIALGADPPVLVRLAGRLLERLSLRHDGQIVGVRTDAAQPWRVFAAWTAGQVAQQPVAPRSVRQACAIRPADNWVTLRRNAERGTVWMLSKFTTQSVGTPSCAPVSSSSETNPRRVLVSP